MRKLFYALLLPLAVMTSACSDDEKNFGDLTVDNKKDLTQSLSADENSATVTFTARDSWTATVTDVTTTRAGLSWLSLDRYEGGTGSYTLKITLSDNTSGADRKAVITATTAGGDKFDVQITQVKTNKDGTTPPSVGTPGEDVALVDRVSIKIEDETYIHKFEYDDNNRIVEMTTTGPNGDPVKRINISYGSNEITATLQRGFTGMSRSIAAADASVKNGHRKPSAAARGRTRSEMGYYQYNCTFKLNPAGHVASGTWVADDWEDERTEWKNTYDSQNYLTAVEYSEDEDYHWTVTCTWDAGNLTRVDTRGYDYAYYSTATYDNDFSNNKANIDINYLVNETDEYLDIDYSEFMGLLGFYGQRSKGLLSSSLSTDEDGSDYGKFKYTYTLDTDKRVTGIKVVRTSTSSDGTEYYYTTEYTLSYKK